MHKFKDKKSSSSASNGDKARKQEVIASEHLQVTLPRKAKNRQQLQILFNSQHPDGKGSISISELRRSFNKGKCSHVPPKLARSLSQRRSIFAPDRVDFETFERMAENLPENTTPSNIIIRYCEILSPSLSLSEDNEKPLKVSCFCPPPFLILLISIAQCILFFKQDQPTDSSPSNSTENGLYNDISNYTNITFEDRYEFERSKQDEIYRFLTYGFFNYAESDLFIALAIQIILGMALEAIHGWWRIGLVYLFGILSGSLASSAIKSASDHVASSLGGAYALFAAQLASVIINFSRTNYAWAQLFLLLTIVIFLSLKVVADVVPKVHWIGGMLGGSLIAVCIFRCYNKHRFILRISAFALYIGFVLCCLLMAFY